MRNNQPKNVPITDAVLEHWRSAWGGPISFRRPNGPIPNKGGFERIDSVTWERFEDGTYHLFLTRATLHFAYRTDRSGDPDWVQESQYKDFLATYGPHAKMVEPDMELEEIHQAQALIANNGGMK